jgi:hypothetical protein
VHDQGEQHEQPDEHASDDQERREHVWKLVVRTGPCPSVRRA